MRREKARESVSQKIKELKEKGETIDFDRLAELGFYTPNPNRKVVAKAMELWGKPVGALYEKHVKNNGK